MTETKEKISSTQQFISDFQKNQKNLIGNKYIQDLREQAIEAFAKQGIPTRKSEEYKYSNPEKILNASLGSITDTALNINSKTVSSFAIHSLETNTLVLINGSFQEDLSSISELPKGIIVCSLKTAFEKHQDLIEQHYAKQANVNSDPFTALNTAFSNDGLVLFVPDNAKVEKAFHIINIFSTNQASHIYQRNLFVIGKNSEVKIIESTIFTESIANYFLNNLSEISVAENAKMQYYVLQNSTSLSPSGREGEGLINTTQVKQEQNSHFDTNTITLNGQWVRNNLSIVLNGQHCETHLNGLFITHDNQHIDNHTLVDHQQPNCQSNQLYKGILNDKSTGIFNGKIFVKKDAQKTNAYQSSKNILLSDDATINTKPQLEIYADDVKCSHGSTTGQIDPDALFYLRARGLGEQSARKLLMFAFAEDVVNTLRIESLKEHISELIKVRLNN